MSVVTAIREMIEHGFSVEQALTAAEIAERNISAELPRTSAEVRTDPATERRREYDRVRKAKKRAEQSVSGGIPVESAEVPNGVYILPSLSISTDKLEDLGTVGERKPAKTRGTRLPADWQPSRSDIEFAQAEGISLEAIRREIAKFRDFWVAKAGAGGVKLDWAATWRNWIRNNSRKSQDNSNGHNRAGNILDAFDRLKARVDSSRDPSSFHIERNDESSERSGLPLLARGNF